LQIGFVVFESDLSLVVNRFVLCTGSENISRPLNPVPSALMSKVAKFMFRGWCLLYLKERSPLPKKEQEPMFVTRLGPNRSGYVFVRYICHRQRTYYVAR
jgi:hypothetical protein